MVLYVSIGSHVHTFLLDKYLEVSLLDHCLCIMSTLVTNGKLCNKLIYKFIVLPGVDEMSS